MTTSSGPTRRTAASTGEGTDELADYNAYLASLDKGRRDDFIVLVGGAPLNQEFGDAVGADAYCRDASIAAETAKTLVSARRARE